MVGYNMNGPARDHVMKLIQEKDRIESEIRDENAVLAANNVGMQDSLVDMHGFPRSDIDVYKVRHARHKIICLQNDHKNIMKQIEQGLSEVHSQFVSNGESTSNSRMHNGHSNNVDGHSNNVDGHTNNVDGPSRNGSSIENNNSFAIVGFVQEGSPADLGGLCENDKVLQFGSINANNFIDVTQLHNIVSHSVGQPIQVQVRRDRHVLNITVVPRPWAQPGLLGCQISRQNVL
ncbi:26S proteasome non-ATPase regulatory subunit 9-like [Nymphalis io]|uniref:26S proteasome non-ATPase regulatory subunit 9-like n=1 Tax=Inachis io TaxID=171585 RepID=UPI002168D8B4|nr:26S proteasome non-ATPase regulatory subunit 9-like [Nymphalis io]